MTSRESRLCLMAAVVVAVQALIATAPAQAMPTPRPRLAPNTAPLLSPVAEKPAAAAVERIVVRFARRVPPGSAARGLAHLKAGAIPVRLLRGTSDVELVAVPRGSSARGVLQRYRNDPSVLVAQPDYRFSSGAVPSDPLFSSQWSLSNTGQEGGTPGADINATAAWDVVTGDSDVVVAVIDSGVDYTHPDLAARIWSNADEVPGDGIDNDGNGYVDDWRGWSYADGTADPLDVFGHGTHVAGTIAAAGNDGAGMTGVAWDARIMALKALDDTGSGYMSDIAEAVYYARDNGADVINMSLTGSDYPVELETAIAAFDGLVVCAAGNEGADNDVVPSYPASLPNENIIAVAATDRHDALAHFSNYGATSVDLGAPGVAILSAVPAAQAPYYPFADYFDPPSYSWLTDGYSNTWALTSAAAWSGPSCYAHAPASGFGANEDSWLYTEQPISFTDSQGGTLYFRCRFNLPSANDRLYVAIAGSDGVWQSLGYLTGSSSGAFFRYQADLSSVAGDAFQLAFVLQTGATPGAPGTGVYIDDVEVRSSAPSKAYDAWSGTSMAAPHVAGAAALLEAAHPEASTLAFKRALLESAEPLPVLAGRTVTGSRLDAAGALAIVDVTPPSTALSVSDPDGDDGWFRHVPLVTMTAEPGASIRYRWGSAPYRDYTVEAAEPGFLGIYPPEGESVLSYFAEDSVGNTETVATKAFKVDSAAPATPVVTLTNTGVGSVTATWEAVVDSASGVDRYQVSRGASVLGTTAAGSFSAAGLAADDEIAVAAVDRAGNVSSDGTATVTTFPLTQQPAGASGAVSVVFANAWTAGTTTASIAEPRTEPLPGHQKLLPGAIWDVHSDTAFSGSFTISLSYDGAALSPTEEASIRLYHYTGGWTDITDPAGLDIDADMVTGNADSFSEYAVGYTPDEEAALVSTPASSDWSISLAALIGLAGVWSAMRRRRAAA